MDRDDISRFVNKLRNNGAGLLLHNDRVVAKQSCMSIVDIRLARVYKSEIMLWLRHEEAATEFVRLYDKGMIEQGISVMIAAKYPCCEDGVNDSGPQGWARVRARSLL